MTLILGFELRAFNQSASVIDFGSTPHAPPCGHQATKAGLSFMLWPSTAYVLANLPAVF